MKTISKKLALSAACLLFTSVVSAQKKQTADTTVTNHIRGNGRDTIELLDPIKFPDGTVQSTAALSESTVYPDSSILFTGANGLPTTDSNNFTIRPGATGGLYIQNVYYNPHTIGAINVTGVIGSSGRINQTCIGNASSAYAQYNFWRGRGTLSSPSGVTGGSTIGRINFNGYNGTSWLTSTNFISGVAHGTFGTSYNPAYFQFNTTDYNNFQYVSYYTHKGTWSILGSPNDTTYSFNVNGTSRLSVTPESTTGTDSILTKHSNGQVGAMAFEQGVYLPTDSASTNIDAITLDSAFYTVVGNVVTVHGNVIIDPTATLSPTYTYINLPVQTVLGDTYWVSGQANSYQFNEHGAFAYGSSTRVVLQLLPTDTGSRTLSYQFSYRIR
ncbi:MAG: hypothetical protein EP332_06340 [Bacteroidetes bacterium]|nr:MAG: hypothetical protein EP332_06340 [Bacteroidota bacterium]